MVQIKIIFLGLVLVSIFLVGCNNKNIEDFQPNIITADTAAETTEPAHNKTEDTIKESGPENISIKNKNQTLTNEYIDMEKLIGNLKNTLNISYYNFTRDKSHPDYVKSSNLKYYVIHTTGNRYITTFEEFCKYYCGDNWDGYRYYINTTEFDLYIPPLRKNNFSSESEYDDYLKDRVLVNYTRKENIYDVENGKVLEYKFWFLEQDELGNFESNLMPYLLIYKVYCSPNITIFIRPRGEKFTLSSPGKIPDVIVNWELEDERIREEMLNNSKKILDVCNVEDKFFDNSYLEPYFQSEMRIWYFRTYYMYQFNLTGEISASAYKKTELRNEFILKDVNISFTNNDIYPLYDLKFNIIVITDDEKEENYYESKTPIYILEPDKSINRSFTLKEIKFLNNITILSNLYIDERKTDIKSLKITFDGKYFGLE